MKRRRRRGERFSEESVDPMNYVSNLSDAMLVLAVGMMLALIVHWNVDISTGGRSSENVGETVAAEGQGGQSAIDRWSKWTLPRARPTRAWKSSARSTTTPRRENTTL